MSARSYFWRWIKTALVHAYGVADGLAGFVGYVSGVLAILFPSTSTAMTNIAAQSILWALAGVAIFRLLMAPYWMAKDEAIKSADLERRLTPDFRMSFDPETVQLAQRLRVSLECSGDATVENLRLFLTRLEKSVGGGPFNTKYLDPVDLIGTPITLSPGIPTPRDVLSARAEFRIGFPSWVYWPANWEDLFCDTAKYRLTLQASSGSRHKAMTIELDWRGQWEISSAHLVSEV